MGLEEKIIKLQEEYQKIIIEIELLKEELKIKKQELNEKEYEFDRENNRLFNINEDIDYNIERNRKQKEKYIKNSLEELEINLFTICSIIFGLIGLILCLINSKNIGIFLTIGFTIGSISMGGAMGLGINNLFKNKYKDKLEIKYEESDEFREYQLQLEEFKKRKEIIEKEHQIKYQIYKNAKDEYNNYLNLISNKKEEINKIKEQLILLVFQNNQIDEIQNITDIISNKDNKLDIDELERKSKIKKKVK